MSLKQYYYDIADCMQVYAIPDIAISRDTSISGADISNILLYRYGARQLISYNDNIADAIKSAWLLYITIHYDSISDMYTAVTADYNPLDNYNMSEKMEETGEDNSTNITGTDTTTTHTGTVTATTDGTVTGTDTRTVTDTDARTEKTTHTGTQATDGNSSSIVSVAAYDSNALVQRDKTDTTDSTTRTDNLVQDVVHGGTTTTTYSGGTTSEDDTTTTTSHDTTDTTAGNTTVKHTGDNTVIRTLTRKGNVGVTTSQQMIVSELDLRAKNILINYICELFVSQYTVW